MHVLTAVILTTCAIGGAPQGELLDFTAPWCGPCQQMAPIVDRLHRQGHAIRKVDFDQNRELARKYQIETIPAFVLVVNGKVVERSVGQQSERALLAMLAKIPKAEPDFPQPRQDQPLLASAPREAGVAARSATWNPTPPPRRTIFGFPTFGGNRTPAVTQVAAVSPPSKNSPPVVRAKLSDEPLVEGDILTRDPMLASIRIRITDNGGVNLGSGTIVESKVGQTLILTCGHIFRNSQPDSLVEVDVFANGKKETFVGKAVRHNLKVDLGLISIPTDNPLPFAQVASGRYQVAKGAGVQSVGCGQGNLPTLQKHVVTQVNRYEGPSNIECTGLPVQGRSGGGLFNQQGEVIGICMAAVSADHRGLYVGLPAIHGFLKDCDLLRLLRNGISPDAESIPTDKESIPTDEESIPTDEESPLVEAEPAKATPATPAPRGLAALQAALGDDAEGVVCLIRSDKSMQKRQRVVVLSGK